MTTTTTTSIGGKVCDSPGLRAQVLNRSLRQQNYCTIDAKQRTTNTVLKELPISVDSITDEATWSKCIMTTTTTTSIGGKVCDSPGLGAQVLNRSLRQQNYCTIDAKQRTTNTVLKELPISVDSITDEDIILYAKQIGIDPQSESHLLWIARKGLVSKLPFPWIAVEDQIGRLYYFNCEREQSSWEHPCDPYYRSLAEQQRLKGSSTTLSMSGLTSIANLHFVDEDIGFRNDGNANQSNRNKSLQIDAKANNQKKPEFSKQPKDSNNNSDEEVESVDFELEVEELLEEEGSDGALIDGDLVTLDVTDGGIHDTTKQFKEEHTIDLRAALQSGDRNTNEYKYRKDDINSDNHKPKGEDVFASESNKIIDVLRDRNHSNVSSPTDSPSIDAKAIHQKNTKQSASTGSQRHNEVSINDFLLDVSEDPFAEFDGYDQNYNDLFGSLGSGVGSGGGSGVGTGVSAKYDNSGNYEQQSSIAVHSSQHKPHKPLETLVETSERDENGLESSLNTGDDAEEDEGDDEEEAEQEEEEEVEEEEDNDNENNTDNEVNGQQIEYRFEEITSSLTEKITTLRNELREEIRKQRNTIKDEMSSKMNTMEDRVGHNSSALRDTKSEISDLRQMIANKNVTQLHTSPLAITQGSAEKFIDINKYEKEMQLLRSDVRSETMDSLRELRNEVNRDIKTKVSSVSEDLEIKFMDFKDESNREMRAVRQELSNVSNNSKNFGQQSNDLKDDLRQTLADIERHRKEHNQQLQRMDSSLTQETQRFQSEVQRLETIMKRIENRIQELDAERIEIRLSTRLDDNELRSSECMARIESIDGQVKELAQQVLQAFEGSVHQNNKTISKVNPPKNSVVNEPKRVLNRDVGPESTQSVQSLQPSDKPQQQTQQQILNSNAIIDDELQPVDISQRMSLMETNIKKICDSFQRLNRNVSQNRNPSHVKSGKQMTNTSKKGRFRDRRHQYSDDGEDGYTSRASSSSLESSSSISDGIGVSIRPEMSGGNTTRRQMHRRGEVHYAAPHNKSIHNISSRHQHHRHQQQQQPHHHNQPQQAAQHRWDPKLQQQHHLNHIRTSSSSLLNLIKKTTKKLRDEAIELESLGNYRFITDFEPTISFADQRADPDNDETAIKKLKSVRLDVDQKLRKLTNVINQQKVSQI
ncbi:unnamed protein product [Medioppia subpectinata]|uniref:WW domain-containing protein n=1 Tax=Medioppia subpectinata TaxID=1979941 RepID=A0A7R9PVS3_9ACAR|nr:unnamed protein product [Medioppia subpectinata]CAG2102099.1 unnamed protein product [Medioppia subpectinata]